MTCLSAAQLKCEEMKEKKRTLEEEFVTTKQEVEQLLDELFNKSCLIERLKAKLHRMLFSIILLSLSVSVFVYHCQTNNVFF